MRGKTGHIICLAATLMLLLCGAFHNEAAAQRRKSSVVKAMEAEKAKEQALSEARKRAMEATKPQGELLEFIVEEGDTIFIDELEAAKIWQKFSR